MYNTRIIEHHSHSGPPLISRYRLLGTVLRRAGVMKRLIRHSRPSYLGDQRGSYSLLMIGPICGMYNVGSLTGPPQRAR